MENWICIAPLPFLGRYDAKPTFIDDSEIYILTSLSSLSSHFALIGCKAQRRASSQSEVPAVKQTVCDRVVVLRR